MNRRKFTKFILIAPLNLFLLSNIQFLLTGCDKSSKEKVLKKQLIALLYSQIISQKLISQPEKNFQLITLIIKTLNHNKMALKDNNVIFKFCNNLPSFEDHIINRKFYDECNNYFLNNQLNREVELFHLGMEATPVILAFATGAAAPLVVAGFSAFAFVVTKGLDFFKEEINNSIVSDPAYINNMNQCIITKTLLYAEQNKLYENETVSIDPSLFAVDQEVVVKANSSPTQKDLLDNFNSNTNPEDYYKKFETKFNELNNSLKELNQLRSRLDPEKQKLNNQVEDFNFNLKEAQGTVAVATTFFNFIGSKSTANAIYKGGNALVSIYSAFGSAALTKPTQLSFAFAGQISLAMFALSSIFQDDEQQVNSIIIKSLNQIQNQLNDIKEQLNRIEKNQILMYDALIKLFEEFRLNNLKVEKSLNEIKNGIYQLKNSLNDNNRDFARQNFAKEIELYHSINNDLIKGSDDWKVNYLSILTEIQDYGKRVEPKFVGTFKGTNTVIDISSKIKNEPYIDFNIASLSEMLKITGVGESLYNKIPNPYEWSLAVNAYLEMRLENLDVKIKSDTNNLLDLWKTGAMLRDYIRKTINNKVANNLMELICNQTGLCCYDDILEKNHKLQTDYITEIDKIENSDNLEKVKSIQSIVFKNNFQNDSTLNMNQSNLLGIISNHIMEYEENYAAKNFTIEKYNNGDKNLNYDGVNTTAIYNDARCVFKVKNDPLTQCIKKNLIKLVYNQNSWSGQEMAGCGYNLINIASKKQILPNSFFYTLCEPIINEVYKKDDGLAIIGTFHESKDPRQIFWGELYCDPTLLLNTCYQLLCENYLKQIKDNFISNLTNKLTNATQKFEIDSTLALYRLFGCYAIWRKQSFEKLPVQREIEGDAIDRTIIIDEKKMVNYNSIYSIDSVENLFSLIDQELKNSINYKDKVPSIVNGTLPLLYPFSIAKGSYKLDLFMLFYSYLSDNLNFLSEVTKNIPNYKTLPIIDHTFIRLEAFMKMQDIPFQKIKENEKLLII
jgi:predicted nuclease with TOPRIM domain